MLWVGQCVQNDYIGKGQIQLLNRSIIETIPQKSFLLKLGESWHLWMGGMGGGGGEGGKSSKSKTLTVNGNWYLYVTFMSGMTFFTRIL